MRFLNFGKSGVLEEILGLISGRLPGDQKGSHVYRKLGKPYYKHRVALSLFTYVQKTRNKQSCRENKDVHTEFFTDVTEFDNRSKNCSKNSKSLLLSLSILFHDISKVEWMHAANLGSINEPAHEIMVFIAQATSEGSDQPAHPCSLTRAFAVRTHELWK